MTPANDVVAAVISFACAVARRHPNELARTWAAQWIAELHAAGVVRLEPIRRAA
ncbi:MAG: hypothetical protein WKG00_18240 [Polyangiaceae bacterium]